MLPKFVNLPLFAAAMVLAALANGLAFFILYRMRSVGYKVGLWRTPRDWVLYREYWRIAPLKNWSRALLPLQFVTFVIAAMLLVMALWWH